METKTAQLKTLTGVVVASKMKDTATVSVSSYIRHPKYKKYYVRTKKYLAHDPGNTAQVGDKVVIRSIRPMSKRKHFEIVK